VVGGADGKRAEALERGHGFPGGEGFEGRNPMSVLAREGGTRKGLTRVGEERRGVGRRQGGEKPWRRRVPGEASPDELMPRAGNAGGGEDLRRGSYLAAAGMAVGPGQTL
jgi:hypothetical protein